MNPKKSGTLFIVLIIALVAFGTASAANVAHIGTGLFEDLNITQLNLTSLNGQKQITAIGDPSFKPTYLTKRIINNTTNGNYTNNTGNNTIPTQSVFGY
ncbi:MAG: hypothetical protein PHY59_02860 [Methanobacterium sp.]|nr:hypothetical protein [Methanobacterium sp.]